MTVEEIAGVCHEANRALCETQGDASQMPWEVAPEWQKETVIDGVKFHLDRPTASASASHENWLKKKKAEGWIYGTYKDADAKTHPCCVSFNQLPKDQQAKDHLFKAVVTALAVLIE